MRRVLLPFVLCGVTCVASGTAESQSRRQGDRRGYRTAVGVGFGIDKVNFDDRTQSRGVTHFTGSVRLSFWDDDDDVDGRRGRPSRLEGYLEPEIGYWSDGELTPFQRDLLVGLNAIANVDAGTVDVFFGGGFGYHFFGSPVEGGENVITDDGAVGANMQFGVDLNFSETIAFFAVGRYDILAGDIYDFQTKILGGLRLKF